jgi:adenylylsulfate kinase-like enzyme
MELKNTNVVWHRATATRSRRERPNQLKSFILWLTGLPSARKSTMAHAVAAAGINHLDRSQLVTFIMAFREKYRHD